MFSKERTEKEWVTYAGLKAAVVTTPMGHRCGYIAVTSANKFYGKDHEDECFCNIEVHGGITFSCFDVETNDYWLGYACDTINDIPDTELADKDIWNEYLFRVKEKNAVVRSLEYCEAQCEKLAEQLLIGES